MSTSDVWTIGRLLQWTADYLKQHGADSPRLDAEVLLAESLGCQRIELYTAFDDVPGEASRKRFRDLVRERAEGKPVAYLVGRREFYSLSFRVTPDVLIPRPETELVVVALLDHAKGRPPTAPTAVADVGTGSGILAVCAAKHLPGCRVTAIDISPAALAVAAQNAADHGVSAQVAMLESDLFAAVPEGPQFDFIVSNPPYVTCAESQRLAADVGKYEPRVALVAGERGTEVIERLVPQAAQRLKPCGWLLVEVSPMVHDAVREIIAAEARLEPAITLKDLSRLPRVVQARRRA